MGLREMSRRWTVSAAIILLIAAVGSPMSAEERRPGSHLKKDHVRFCADAANLPFSSQDGQIPGFEVELARLIARELSVEARFQWILTWVRPYWELKRGECDVFMGLPPSPRLTQANPWIAVSRPYYTMTYAIVARADAAIREPSDLAGKRVAVDAGRPAEYWLLEHGFERGIYKRQEDVFRGVEVGEAPAGLLPLPLATWLSRDKAGLVVIPLAEPSLASSLGAATRRDDGPLTEVVDDTIARLLATGAIEEILRQYKAVP
jgi:polar amino acid transport system substrate-binding protein